jgi:hypothetical protein
VLACVGLPCEVQHLGSRVLLRLAAPQPVRQLVEAHCAAQRAALVPPIALVQAAPKQSARWQGRSSQQVDWATVQAKQREQVTQVPRMT